MKILLLLIVALFAENWTATKFVERNDTMFVIEDSVYCTRYYQVGDQKYYWVTSTFDLDFDVQSKVGSFFDHPYALDEIETLPIDTINTWGLYHKGVEIVEKHGIMGMPLRKTTYQDSFLVLEFANPDSRLLSDFSVVMEFMAEISTMIYRRVREDGFKIFVNAQNNLGDAFVYLDRDQHFIDYETRTQHSVGVRLFNSAAYIADSKYPFSAYYLKDKDVIIVQIPTIHPMAPIQNTANNSRKNFLGAFAEGRVTIVPTAVGKELTLIRRDKALEYSWKHNRTKYWNKPNPPIASASGTYKFFDLSRARLMEYLKENYK